MLVAIISDIHSNYDALKSTLADAEMLGVELYIFCGDMLGYYYMPNECIESLKKNNYIAIRGNHDQIFIDSLVDNKGSDEYRKKYGSSLDITKSVITEENLEWIISLPGHANVTLDGFRIGIFHGSHDSIDEYLYRDVVIERHDDIKKLDFDLICFGHTHHPFHIKIEDKIILNPGSVGQPRNRQPGAHWALLDTMTHEINLMISSYDSSHLISECLKRDPKISYLHEVLVRI
ncbi:metallophosphoesterase family protein [Chromobacterium vaccinii]|nr:metallophosphoesterase family protein [Chromobacterium vaccinii]